MEANINSRAIVDMYNLFNGEELKSALDNERNSNINSVANILMAQMKLIVVQNSESRNLDQIAALIGYELRKANRSEDKKMYNDIQNAMHKTIELMSKSNTKKAKECHQLLSQALKDSQAPFRSSEKGKITGETIADVKKSGEVDLQKLADVKKSSLDELNLQMLRSMGMTSKEFNSFINTLHKSVNNDLRLAVELPFKGEGGEIVALKLTNVTNKGLEQLKANFPNIQSLDLSDSNNLTSEGLSHLSGMTNLQNLSLAGCKKVDDKALSHLRELTNLQSLNLENTRVTDEGLDCLSKLINLRDLNLAGCSELKGDGLSYLSGLTELRSLNLGGCASLKELAPLSGLINLQNLILGACFGVSDNGLASLSGLRNLQDLNLYYCPYLTDKGIAHLSGLTNLQNLNVKGCKKITEAGIKPFKDRGVRFE